MGFRGPELPEESIETGQPVGEAQAAPEPAAEVSLGATPLILGRNEHPISRKLIDPDALKVLYRLLRSGYKAYLVGGAVRDLLLGKTPKDYDVGTDAHPEVVRSLFRNSRIIGRRFRLNHVFFQGNKIIEVATFRAFAEPESEGETVTLAPDNTYGDPRSDAMRRDLTINGMFYDLGSYSIIDYVGGIRDLREGVIRIIGDPDVRLVEDPIRMIRAIRHAARTGFNLEEQTYQSICRNSHLIKLCPTSRLYEEFSRELKEGHAQASFALMHNTGLLRHLVPLLNLDASAPGGAEYPDSWTEVTATLAKIDKAIAKDPNLSVYILYLAMALGRLRPDFLDRGDRASNRVLRELWGAPVNEDLTAGQSPDQEPASQTPADRLNMEQIQLELRKIIHELYWPLGVSRRERELMEMLLLLRRRLFESADKQRRTSLERRPHFADALLLVSLTASDQRTQDCLNYWQQMVAGEDFSAGGSAVRRRRRKRRRRRSGNRAPREI